MVMFVEAGVTPMQAIQAGTINVAKVFGAFLIEVR